MNRCAQYMFINTILFTTMFLVSGCLTDTTNNDDNDSTLQYTKKTLTVGQGVTKLIEDADVSFTVTSTPEPELSEWLVCQFVGPDTTRCIVQNAHTNNEIRTESFKAGDWTLVVAIYDSTEYKTLGGLAPNHGSSSVSIAVRRITMDMEAYPLDTSQNYVIHVNSTERDWIPSSAEYDWAFGDGETLTTTGTDQVIHHFGSPGDYEVIVSIKCSIYKNDNTKYVVSTDTLTITVAPDMDVFLQPEDTVWSTATLSLNISPSIDYTDYPETILWVIDYGDGKSEEDLGYLNDRTFEHNYQHTGTYTCSISLYIPDTSILIAKDTTTVTIDNVSFLMKTGELRVSVLGTATYHQGSYDTEGIYTENTNQNKYMGIGAQFTEFTWDNLAFFAEYKLGLSPEYYSSYQVEGALSSDGESIATITFSEEFVHTDAVGYSETGLEKIILENVPLSAISNEHFGFAENAAFEQYIIEFQNWRTTDYDDGTSDTEYYDNPNWQDMTLGVPQLIIDFHEP